MNNTTIKYAEHRKSFDPNLGDKRKLAFNNELINLSLLNDYNLYMSILTSAMTRIFSYKHLTYNQYAVVKGQMGNIMSAVFPSWDLMKFFALGAKGMTKVRASYMLRLLQFFYEENREISYSDVYVYYRVMNEINHNREIVPSMYVSKELKEYNSLYNAFLNLISAGWVEPVGSRRRTKDETKDKYGIYTTYRITEKGSAIAMIYEKICFRVFGYCVWKHNFYDKKQNNFNPTNIK